MSGLLSAMMMFSNGSQFGLDFGIVEVDDRNLSAAERVHKCNRTHVDRRGVFFSFSRNAIRELMKTAPKVKCIA